MASKGPKSAAVQAPKPAVTQPIATKPVARPSPAARAIEPAPVIEKPVAAEPVPTPVVAAPPVATQESEPAVAPAPVITRKEALVETIQSASESAQAQAKTMFANANERAKSAMEKGSKMIEDMNDFSKGNIEAIVESSKIAAKGIETMGQEAADYGRKQFESATVALKTLSSVKSPTDFFKLHNDYMRQAFDSMVAETSKNTESMLKLAGEIAQPISNRVALAAEKMKIAA